MTVSDTTQHFAATKVCSREKRLVISTIFDFRHLSMSPSPLLYLISTEEILMDDHPYYDKHHATNRSNRG